MAPDPKVIQAFRAMKDLGIPAETVKPVLKNLLRLYDKRWELIEEDNYRTLADAIFESREDKLREYKRKDGMVHERSEPPFKKPHWAQQEDQVSSTVDNVNTMSDPDEYQILQTSILPTVKELSQSCLDDRQPHINDNGKDPINDLPHLAVPISMIHSGSSSTAVDFVKYSMSENADNGIAGNSGTNSEGSFDIASSPSGEVKVKLSLDCNSALGQSNFHTPNLDAVLKYVENKYLRSYRIVGPQFSVTKLLKELCESYLELGTDSTNRSLVERSGDSDGRIWGPSRKFPGTGSARRELNKKESSFSGSSSMNSLVIAEQQPTAHGKKRSVQRISDIAKGMEKVRISLIDEIGNEQTPNFNYIPQNTIYQHAYIHFSLARIADEDCCSDCSGDCLSFSVPCACARDTGGEFAYTRQGLLTEEFLSACISMNQEPQKHYNFYCEDCPLERAKNGDRPESCKGHLVRKFIKECWRKCGCNLQCGNRVVQRGISRNLQVFLTTDGKGWGLRTLEELPKGAFVCEYVGEILTNMELYERNKQSSGNVRHTYPVLLDADWGSEGVLKDEDALCLDATYYGNIARFINHRCFDGNLLEIPVQVETPDHHYYHLAFFTKRKVEALEELTWDYGIDFDDHNHPIKAFQCCCESAFCRGQKKWN